MKDSERIRKIFEAMDRLFDDSFYGGIMHVSDDYGDRKRQSYGGEGFDIFMDDENVYITIELEGVSEEGLKIEPEEDKVLIGGNIENRYYENIFPLPDKVVPESITKTFNNSLLDIVLKRKKK